MLLSSKMSNPHIFPIPEIDSMIIDHLYLKDFKQLVLVNKYYYEFINNNPIYRDFSKFVKAKDLELGISNQPEKEHIFCLACKFDCPYVTKYIFDRYPINIHINHDYPFRLSCIGGNLELVKWLYSLLEKTENLYDYIRCGFNWACENGHLEVAQYLYYHNKINIREVNDYAFTHSCKNGHLDTINWLCTLCDKYQYKTDYSPIFYGKN